MFWIVGFQYFGYSGTWLHGGTTVGWSDSFVIDLRTRCLRTLSFDSREPTSEGLRLMELLVWPIAILECC